MSICGIYKFYCSGFLRALFGLGPRVADWIGLRHRQMSYMQLTFGSGQRYANNPLLGLNAIFKRMDQNHSGKVDHNEFLQLCSILDFNGSVDLMNALFNRYDLDRLGIALRNVSPWVESEGQNASWIPRVSFCWHFDCELEPVWFWFFILFSQNFNLPLCAPTTGPGTWPSMSLAGCSSS